MRLGRHPLALRCFHTSGNLVGIALAQQQSRAQEQLAVLKRRVAIIPTNLTTGNLDDVPAPRYAHSFNDGSYFLTVGSRLQPHSASARPGHSIGPFDPG